MKRIKTMQYTTEQEVDIKSRIDKAVTTLKELELTVGINPIWAHKGNGEYVMQLLTNYVDLKYKAEKTDASTQ